MAYCTVEDIKTRISSAVYDQLLNGLTADQKNSAVTGVIADAAARIDISGRSLSDALKKYIGISISAFLLYNRFGHVPDGIKHEYEEAVRLLGNAYASQTGIIYKSEENETESDLNKILNGELSL